ncbi:hypothetical protein SLS62_006368 [Diatrype stigma]|uniref:AAA+ ATPase lid domain-containing protein n=1 Tax=Diatrype stigma TaxID=117547 RepID=A0AAN9URK8_9PEZI
MGDDQYMMCPPRVLGYALKQKQWAQLLVDHLEVPDAADAGTFKNKLPLDEESKDLAQKLVRAHEQGKMMTKSGIRALEDFAPGKGKGLVIMLYALMAGKPLLSRSFDIAVQSRIHTAIKYEELTQEQKINIFKSFFDQLQKKKLVDLYDNLMQWVSKEGKRLQLNGRQIRNVVSTALGLALMDDSGQSKKLRPEHLKQVAEQTKNFKQDLGSQEAVYKSTRR